MLLPTVWGLDAGNPVLMNPQGFPPTQVPRGCERYVGFEGDLRALHNHKYQHRVLGKWPTWLFRRAALFSSNSCLRCGSRARQLRYRLELKHRECKPFTRADYGETSRGYEQSKDFESWRRITSKMCRLRFLSTLRICQLRF